MQRAFAVLFVVSVVGAALTFGSVAASAQAASAALPAVLPTPTPAPMPTPAPTPAGQPDERLAVVGPNAADLWNSAGTEMQVMLPAGALLTAVGRSADGKWLYVYPADGTKPKLAAIHGSDVIVVDAASLPVLAPNPAPDILHVSVVAVSPQAAPTPSAAKITESAPITAEVNAGSVQLNVRSDPGTSYPIVAKVATGTVLTVLARNDTGDWVEVATIGTAGSTGWVSTAYIELSQPAGDLPVAVPSNLPAPGSLPAPSQALTATLLADNSPSQSR